jgi:hypothetical protein
LGDPDVEVQQQQLLPPNAVLTPSSQLQDWYSTQSSDIFQKNVVDFELSSRGVIVEATE